MNPLALLPLRDWGYIALALTIAALGALFVHHERQIGAQKAEAQLQHERADVAQAAASAAAAAALESQRRETAFQEIASAAQQATARIAADAAAGAADRRSLGVQLDAFVRANGASSNPRPAASGPPATDPLSVLADMFSRADSRAEDLARIADERGAAGSACERSYDALTKPAIIQQPPTTTVPGK